MTETSVITVDGPAGSGKGTVAHQVAAELGWHILDSGALYRLVAHQAIQKKVALDDEKKLAELARNLDVVFVAGEEGESIILLEGEDVTYAIRTEECGGVASQVAVYPLVREALLDRQRDFLQEPGLVADGRDMGTVVFPGALVKVYLTASARVRAERRQRQLKEQGVDVKVSGLVRDIESRDARDCGRRSAPLKAAEDAIVIDTDSLSIDEVVDQVLSVVKARL